MAEAAIAIPSEIRTPRRIYDAQLRLKIHCGCGESFDNLASGQHHAESSGHTLTISGEIRVTK